MATYKPVHGGFIRQCIEYIDPALGFAIRMNFSFAVSKLPKKVKFIFAHTKLVSWVMIIPAEFTTAVSVLRFWPETNVIPLAAYITIFLVFIALGKYIPCQDLWIHRVLHVVYQMPGCDIE